MRGRGERIQERPKILQSGRGGKQEWRAQTLQQVLICFTDHWILENDQRSFITRFMFCCYLCDPQAFHIFYFMVFRYFVVWEYRTGEFCNHYCSEKACLENTVGLKSRWRHFYFLCVTRDVSWTSNLAFRLVNSTEENELEAIVTLLITDILPLLFSLLVPLYV